jgi:hypothetical protein
VLLSKPTAKEVDKPTKNATGTGNQPKHCQKKNSNQAISANMDNYRSSFPPFPPYPANFLIRKIPGQAQVPFSL